MKAEFKKSKRHAQFYLLCLLYIICIADIWFFGGTAKVYGFGMIVVAAIITPRYIGKYTVTDDDILNGNGTVYIKNISKIVYQKDRVDVYYQDTETEKTKFKTYFPKDREAFVDKLKEINPVIQIV